MQSHRVSRIVVLEDEVKIEMKKLVVNALFLVIHPADRKTFINKLSKNRCS